MWESSHAFFFLDEDISPHWKGSGNLLAIVCRIGGLLVSACWDGVWRLHLRENRDLRRWIEDEMSFFFGGRAGGLVLTVECV